MHVIVFAVHLDNRLKVGTYATEHAAHIVRHVFREHLATVFGHKDQMSMKRENAVPRPPASDLIAPPSKLHTTSRRPRVNSSASHLSLAGSGGNHARQS